MFLIDERRPGGELATVVGGQGSPKRTPRGAKDAIFGGPSPAATKDLREEAW